MTSKQTGRLTCIRHAGWNLREDSSRDWSETNVTNISKEPLESQESNGDKWVILWRPWTSGKKRKCTWQFQASRLMVIFHGIQGHGNSTSKHSKVAFGDPLAVQLHHG